MFVKCNSRLLFQSNKRCPFSTNAIAGLSQSHFYWAPVWLSVVNITVPLEYQSLPLIDLKGEAF